MTTRALKGVAVNFLGTYLSRYSDYQGYWLFGFRVPSLTEMRIDLLRPPKDNRPAFQLAIDLGKQKFDAQLLKGGFIPQQVRAAELSLTRDPAKTVVELNGVSNSGWAVIASVMIESNHGRCYHASRRILVAEHNSAREYRSTRAG